MTEIFHKMPDTSFRFSIDRGGTFTDVYAEVPGEPEFRVVKLLSEDPQNYADAPREGIRRIMESVTGKSYHKKASASLLLFLQKILSGFAWVQLLPQMRCWREKERKLCS